MSALFPLGRLVATSGALNMLRAARLEPLELVARHWTGDWGDLSGDDKAENEYALDRSLRIFSAYRLSTGDKVYIITEADRSCTTVLLNSEY